MKITNLALTLTLVGSPVIACASNPPPPSQQEVEQTRQDHDKAQQDMDKKMEDKDKREAEKQPPGASVRHHGFVFASYQAKPAWVRNPYSGKYSESSYLAAVGQGPSQAAAENDAKAGVSKIFESKIKAETTVVQKYFQNSQGSAKSMGMEKRNQVGTERAIKGLKIAETAAGGGTFYALAVLERGPAAERIREDMAKVEGEIKAKMKAGDGASDKVKAFKSYGAALEKMEIWAVYNSDIMVLENGRGAKPPVDWEDINSKFEGAKENLKVGIDVVAKVNIANLEGKAKAESSRIEACLKEEMHKMGLEFQDDDDDLDLKLTAEAMFQPVEAGPNTALVNVEMNLQVINVKKNNKVLHTWTHTVGKVDRSNFIASVSTAATKVCKESVTKFGKEMKKFLSK